MLCCCSDTCHSWPCGENLAWTRPDDFDTCMPQSMYMVQRCVSDRCSTHNFCHRAHCQAAPHLFANLQGQTCLPKQLKLVCFQQPLCSRCISADAFCNHISGQDLLVKSLQLTHFVGDLLAINLCKLFCAGRHGLLVTTLGRASIQQVRSL